MLDHTGLDVGKLGAEAAPQIAVPFGHDTGVGALVFAGEVGVDENSFSLGVIGEEHRESNVVGVSESDRLCCAVIGNAIPLVGSRGAAHGVAIEDVASAFVGDELEAVRGGSPAGDVSDVDAIHVVVSVNLGEAVDETHQNTSWLVALEDTVGEIEEPVALAGGVGVGHAAVEVACDEALADRASIPAVGPLGLNGDDFEVTNLVHALDDVDDDASELVVTLGRDAKEGVRRVANVLSEDNLFFATVLGHAGEGRCIEIVANPPGRSASLTVTASNAIKMTVVVIGLAENAISIGIAGVSSYSVGTECHHGDVLHHVESVQRN